MKLVKALHFESYLGLDRKVLDRLFCKYCARDEVSESFLHDLAGSFCPDLEERVSIATLLKVFSVPSSYIQSVYEQFPEERGNHVRRFFRLLVAWKDIFDTGGSTYQSLRTTLDKYSIFCGRDPRDPVSYLLKCTQYDLKCFFFYRINVQMVASAGSSVKVDIGEEDAQCTSIIHICVMLL